MIPLWSLLALAAALTATATPLIQEKFKADPFSLAFWVRIFIMVFSLPFVLHYGFPLDPHFYFYTLLTAFLYTYSDIQYFRAVPVIGSGLMTRLLPASVVITFFLWFVFDPSLIAKYLAVPWRTAAILTVMVFFIFSASHVKKCETSWKGVKLIWFVLTAACIGPIFTKLGLNHANNSQGVFGYLFIQNLTVIFILLGVYKIKKPIDQNVLLSKQSMRTGFILGLIMGATMVFKTKALQLVDNPGFVSMILFTDALWVLLVYKIIGKKEKANVWAGLGIVLSAVLIVLIKSV